MCHVQWIHGDLDRSMTELCNSHFDFNTGTCSNKRSEKHVGHVTKLNAHFCSSRIFGKEDENGLFRTFVMTLIQQNRLY